MAASSDEPREPVPSCPDCGMAVSPGQRRCTNCGASVEARRRLPRRTPLIAALTVAALSGGIVVVAQAAVTEEASIDAAAPADAASAPVSVAGAALPPAKRATSTAPKVEEPPPAPSTPSLDIPTVDDDLLDQAAKARDEAADANSKDGEPVDADKKADPDDLDEPRTVKIVKAINYEPVKRLGVEFGKPKAAIDKRSRTVWDVTIPADGQPYNVGIVLDLGDESHRVSSLTMGTPTPGFGIELYRSDAEEVPDTLEDWTKASDPTTASDDTILPLTADDPKWARYVLVYLTTTASADVTRAAISNLEVLP
jgi:predicted nucleic acid-binding Zn ribbon protein